MYTSAQRKAVSEMIGEFLREAGVLLTIFVPLDALFSEKTVAPMIVVVGMVVSAVFLILGATEVETMSVVSTWLAFMGFGVGIFLVGLLWVRKERRDRAKSSSRLHKYETSAHLGTDLVDTNRQDR